jgi:hypothetical protein
MGDHPLKRALPRCRQSTSTANDRSLDAALWGVIWRQTITSRDKLIIQIRVLLHLHSQRTEAVILDSTVHGSFQKRVRFFYHGLDHRSLIQAE